MDPIEPSGAKDWLTDHIIGIIARDRTAQVNPSRIYQVGRVLNLVIVVGLGKEQQIQITTADAGLNRRSRSRGGQYEEVHVDFIV